MWDRQTNRMGKVFRSTYQEDEETKTFENGAVVVVFR
jgi:hypothetical protein